MLVDCFAYILGGSDGGNKMQDVCSEPDRYSSARFRLATARVWARLGFTWFLTPPRFYRPAMEIIFLVRNVVVLIEKCIALAVFGGLPTEAPKSNMAAQARPGPARFG